MERYRLLEFCNWAKIIQAGMFNQNSTEGERRAFLEKLLDDDQQAANEVGTKLFFIGF